MAGARMRSVPRSDLAASFVADLVEHRLGVIEGGPGYGRSALLHDVLAAWPHETAGWPPMGGVRVLRAALRARPAPCLVHVDDADELPLPDRMALAAAAGELPPQHRLVLVTSGRCLMLRRLAGDLPGPRVGPADLLWSVEDIARRLWGTVTDPEATALAVHVASGGWAEGVQAALRARADQRLDPEDVARSAGALVAKRVTELAPVHRQAFARALTLPRMREPLMRLLTGGADLVEALHACRVPVAREDGDAWALPWPLDRALFRRSLDREHARRAALLARDAGRPEEAFLLLWEGGHHDMALGMLERAEGPEAYALVRVWRGPVELEAGYLRAAPRAADRLLHAAELAGYPDRLSFQRRHHAGQLPGPDLDGRMDAQAARDLLQRGCTVRATVQAGRVLREHSSPAARAGALEVLGRAARRRGSPRDLAQAERLLMESLALWRQAGEAARVAQVRLHLSRVDRDRGALSRGLERARSVRRAALEGSGLWAHAALAEADLLCDAGSCDAAGSLLARIDMLSSDWAGPRTRQRLAVVRARAALHAEDWDGAATWATHAMGVPLGWLDGVHGVRNVAALAEIWSRLGATQRAVSALRLLRTLQRGPDAEAALARAAVAARVGDPVRALAHLRVLARQPSVPPRERWRVVLLAAVAAARCEPDEAPALTAEALRIAACDGLPFAPFVREREVVRDLLRVAGPVAEVAG